MDQEDQVRCWQSEYGGWYVTTPEGTFILSVRDGGLSVVVTEPTDKRKHRDRMNVRPMAANHVVIHLERKNP